MAEGIKKISENVIIDKRALIVTDLAVADNAAISVGALWTDPINKGLKIKTAANTLSYLDASNVLISGSIGTNLLADKSVTNIKIADKAVDARTIVDNTITSIKIKNSAITEEKLATDSVVSSKIKSNSLVTRHYADYSITGVKIADNTIDNNKLIDKTISSNKINDNAIIDRTIANKALKERHYSDLSIPNSALQKGIIFGDVIKDKGINSNHLADNSVSTRAILNGAVTSAKIAENSISNIHLQQSCIESKNIANNVILSKHIDNEAITTSKYKDKSITKDKLSDEVIDLIGDPVTYDSNNDVHLRHDLDVNGNVVVAGSLTANKVYNAVFMDLAEGYAPAEDEVFIPGDIVQVNEDGLLVKAIASSQFPIVGVVSDEYAACYGATEEELEEGTKIPVGLIGKIHVNVIGPVTLGDKIALAKDGMGASQKTNNLLNDHIIGKALETNLDSELKKVLCLVYPR